MFAWLSKDKTNAAKVKKIAVRHAVQRNIAVAQLQQEREKNILFKQFCLQVAPLRERKDTINFCSAIANAIVDGVLFAINDKSPLPPTTLIAHDNSEDVHVLFPTQCNKHPEEVLVTTNTDEIAKTTTTEILREAAELLQSVVQNAIAETMEKISTHITNAKSVPSKMKGHTVTSLSWLERSALIWVFLCPSVYPNLSGAKRLQKISDVGGVEVTTIRKWTARSNDNAWTYVHKWYHIVKSMVWKDVKYYFPNHWVIQHAPLQDDAHVRCQLRPYEQFTHDKPMSLNKYMGTAPSQRASLSKKRSSEFQHMSGETKRAKRTDSGKARKYPEIASGMQDFVETRWYTGDPCTRRSVEVSLVF